METLTERSYGIIPLQEDGGQWLVLLIKHRNGDHWAFPKGKPEKDETTFETAQRELFEETGLQVVEFVTKIPYLEHYSFLRRGITIKKKVEYYSARVQGEIRLQIKEIKDSIWVPLNEAKTTVTFSEAKRICIELEKHLS